MYLNCDLGESFGPWKMGLDEEVMPLIDQANIACGFHASDPLTMHRTLLLAVAHDVQIGAHPAYPDLVGFGRRSMKCTEEELKSLIWYQIGALNCIAGTFARAVSYVQPHGALNNDMMRSESLLRTVMEAVAACSDTLQLMIPVSNQWQAHQALADSLGIDIILEAFADRAYTDEGLLVPRSEPDSVHHDEATIVAQARSFAERGGIESINGQWLELPARSLCVHGDNPESVQAVRAIRHALDQAS